MFRLLSTVLLIAAAGQLVTGDAATDHCDKESLALEIGDNPILRALQKGSSIHRCSKAMTNEYLRIAQIFWDEIACIEVVNKQSTSLSKRLLPTLKRIVRDYVTKVLAPGSVDQSNIRKLLDFVQYTNISGPHAYEFLLSELKSFPYLVYNRDNLVFELGLEIKTMFGTKSEAFKALPTVVQNILSDKPIRLQNAATKKYLSYKEFEDKSQAHMNAMTVESVSDASTVWNPISELDGSFEAEVTPSTFPVYFIQFNSTVQCAKPDCYGMLSESMAPQNIAILTKFGYFLSYQLDTPSLSFSLQLVSEDAVMIKRSTESIYVPMTLTESISGGLRFLPQTFYHSYASSVEFTEFLHLDYNKESNRSEVEMENDLLRNHWIVSLA